MLRLVLIGIAAAVCAGCAETGKRDAEPAFESSCPRGLTRPISVHTLIEVARAHGVSLERDPSCYAYIGSVDAASNAVDAYGDDYDEITNREGHVLCQLDDDPQRRLEPVLRSKYPEDEETRFSVGNVSCTIYPKRPQQLERLRLALVAVGRQPIVRRNCPDVQPRPIGRAALVEAALRHGIALRQDLRCIAPGVVAQASNVVPYEDDPGDYDIEFDQGRVTCLLRRATDSAKGKVEEATATVTTQFLYRNVECWVTTQTKRHVDAVRAVFEDLSAG